MELENDVMQPEGGSSAAGDVEIKRPNFFLQILPLVVILFALILCFAVFYGIFGQDPNFENWQEVREIHDAWDPASGTAEPLLPNQGHPIPPHADGYSAIRNFMGTVFKGGFVIPFGMSLFVITLLISIERAITIFLATGRGNVDVFVKKVRMLLSRGDIDGAMAACDRQKGSVANVIRAGLLKYREVEKKTDMDKDQQKAAIQKELEEATTLELPMLEKNLVIIATIVSIGVLVGLAGTVLGMIKAFSALATAGAPDATALATGISEALINTALGITTSTVSLVLYNFFTSKIDGLTYAIDEAGYSIVQTFDSTH